MTKDFWRSAWPAATDRRSRGNLIDGGRWLVFAPFFTSRRSGWRLKASAGPFLLGNLSAPPVSNRCSARVAEQIEVLPHVRDQKNDQDIDRKCCNFENGDGGRPERNWAAKSQAGRSNSWSMNRFCLRTSASLTHRACPFRIMCIASYPSIVRRAAWNSRKLCLAFTRRLIAR